MPRRCRLKARAEIDKAVREPGYEFTLADGERGPHRTVRPVHPSIHASHVAGHDHEPSEGADEPLFDVIEEIPAEPPAEAAAAPVDEPQPVTEGDTEATARDLPDVTM